MKPQARAMAAAVLLLFFRNSARIVLYSAAFLDVIPAFFFWRCSLRLNEELDRKG